MCRQRTRPSLRRSRGSLPRVHLRPHASSVEGLKVPHRHPKRGRLWRADGSCIRLRPQHRNHVWSYDFVEDRTHDGRRYRMLNVLDEFTHECLAIRVARKLKAIDVIDILSDLIILRGIPGHIWVRQWTGVRRRGRAKILRALQLITNGSGGNPEVTIDPQTAGTGVWAQNCRDRRTDPAPREHNKNFCYSPCPRAMRVMRAESGNPATRSPLTGHPIALARWGSCAETSRS
jgi:hypothetical protein